MFKKILIANRGEIAVRVIRACRELGIATVAVYSQADEDSLHVKLADESVCIGPAPNKESYLNAPNIISAAVITGADAIHPGYGYFSEVPGFAEACEACKIKFIGPPSQVIERMGNKAAAREIMQSAGIPVIPGTKGILQNELDAQKTAAKMGYPVLIKAAAGGGGKGIRLVQNEEEMGKVLKIAQAEAEAAFGNSDVYMEKFIEEPRHIEVQILADSRGHVVHLGERECSIQNARHQKMLEEAPSAALSSSLRNKMGEAAIKAAKAVGYENAGTIEFLLDAKNNFYFMEMNTRVQVEHPITEVVTGVDILTQQILIASGEKLSISQKDVQVRGHAIECRITAEDPDRNFTPSSGRVESLIIPGGFGVRVDTHLYAGYNIPPYYDSLLAKLIVWAPDRTEAIRKMSRCLSEFKVEGLKTNIPFHQKIMANAFYRRGELTTNFIKRRMSNGSG
ncbi:MAG TPA: acetyl-CoA carboxylase biotin carboxylase subunit [Armatimonadetes bacterium]|jgi:acetyl-CoA carboxylase biotin carboxylase subunit|nr:acetyl-CoA carboxylase biotin carboxylase subunit [Armatimonadota bacterium]